MAAPPGSPAALADQIGSTYHAVEAAKGLSTRPPLVEVLLLEDELELLEPLLEDELLELELLEEVMPELLLDELDDELEELLDDELELEVVELDEPLIAPVEAVSVTRSSFDPSSLRTSLRV